MGRECVEWRRRMMWEGQKEKGGGAGDVFIDLSASAADMAATGLLFVGRDTIYLL